MTETPATSDSVVITAKRLDSEDAEETSVEVRVPDTEIGQRHQLTELVHARYPEAEFRSFADEAASFLAHKVLIVAVYRRSTLGGEEDGPPDDESQQQLFAA